MSRKGTIRRWQRRWKDRWVAGGLDAPGGRQKLSLRELTAPCRVASDPLFAP